jgi:DNA processing protein
MEPARTLVRGEAGFPARLAAIPDPPAQLRLRGALGPAGLPRVAVVGSRECDGYGIEMARAIAGGLARAGVSVVSGGAEGVDAEAHRAALEAGGHTVAVFGNGLDVVFPAAHRELFARIAAAGGALLSEYEDDRHGERWTFPQRNRLISGLSLAVVVVRAGVRSGALITADWARRQGVPVLAVPGDATLPLSAGPHALLRSGARLATSAGDVLEAIGLSGQAELPLSPSPAGALQGAAAAAWAALTAAPLHADEVARAAGLTPGQALAALFQLELDGLVEQRPGQRFLRRG